ncbi:SDR family oxidoreductase [Nostoc sp. UHCC 0870]|uniref:SDR family oxidoreductase n=1 Tax=Nostoc sp. UHCC 0870 TaxID=2914041 RepID=UPI0030D96E8D
MTGNPMFVLYGIAAVLPIMRQQKSGHVINLSSVAGHKVFPGSAVYCATKYAVRAISEGLRLESNGEIRSTNISPGAVATELTTTITDKDTAARINQLYAIAIDADVIARAGQTHQNPEHLTQQGFQNLLTKLNNGRNLCLVSILKIRCVCPDCSCDRLCH